MAALGSWVGIELLGTGLAEAAPVAPTGGRIALIGDSLTQGTMRYQADAFTTAGWTQSTIDAHNSRGVRTKLKSDPYTGLTAVDAIRATRGEPDLWVVALGTNDAGIYSKGKQQEIIGEMMDRIGGGHSVLWVNVYRPELGSREQAWNSALTAVAAERPNQMYVYDWAALADKNQKWIATDRVHCTGMGYEFRATAIAQATRAIVPASAVTPSHSRQAWLKTLAG
jgi:lysophospholipase L1-like esterase